ncbi:PREDICTED: uncharacterized protein LOC106101571 [Papilio polytes]|uniref:uncharacterized protein LOC106101571 n=1 Tax=Papilio polytes TaxID=76194 RepID=UPI0006768C04|nr:PREDICTED: uncharacterized protein LOC106101571 [Papilio polytes]
MPEDKKSNRKSDPKDQRKSRRRHDQQVDKKDKQPAPKPQPVPVQKNTEPAKDSVPEKPVYEPPGPEFYKNLKRETDDILKITEEANSKYKKKEIQSNWAKYEMPIESYNEIEEQENIGADYEALIQAPLSVGGHFQFKHEKSWDNTTGPSLYDKYFEIDMDNLAIALSTIPFYERNCIDQSLFSETDIFNMNNRATKFKQKYYNDKSYTTPEMEAQDRILKKLRESEEKESTVSDEKGEVTKDVDFTNLENKNDIEHEEIKTSDEKTSKPSPVKFNNLAKIEPENIDTNKIKEIESVKQIVKIEEKGDMKEKSLDNKHIDNIDDIIAVVENKKVETPKKSEPKTIVDTAVVTAVVENISPAGEQAPQKNPVIESPEDLEKWLDDFLDG